MIRRRALAAVALAVLLTTSGCAFLTGEPLTFTANKATVSQQALDQTGYQAVNVESQNVTRPFSAAGQTKNVTVVNWLAQYERAIQIPGVGSRRAGVFAVFSTPQVNVLGQTFNPVADMSNREILQRFASQYQDVEVGQKVGQQNVTVLGDSAVLKKYEGTATLSGQSVDVYIHVTKVQRGGDIVVALAIYPQQLSGEQQRVVTLTEGIEHEAKE